MGRRAAGWPCGPSSSSPPANCAWRHFHSRVYSAWNRAAALSAAVLAALSAAGAASAANADAGASAISTATDNAANGARTETERIEGIAGPCGYGFAHDAGIAVPADMPLGLENSPAQREASQARPARSSRLCAVGCFQGTGRNSGYAGLPRSNKRVGRPFRCRSKNARVCSRVAATAWAGGKLP
ncbi:hypothetical protein D3C71_1601700 [compost metagenome]